MRELADGSGAGANSDLHRFFVYETDEVWEFLREPRAEFDGDEVLVCMVLAFCIAGASMDVIYKLFG